MGRRWGKTLMAGSLALAEAYGMPPKAGAAVAWVVPSYRNARALWRFTEQHAAQHGELRRSEMSVQFKRGGHITIYTADNDVSMRGETFDLVVVDEAAQVREETWTDVIMPTLADRNGRAMLISTPKGRNWFWREFQRGLQDGKHQASFTAPSSANPMESIQRAALMAKERVSERTYKQEWLAQFVEDGGGVFRNVRLLSTAQPEEPREGAQYFIGVDWGRTNDETVNSVWDVGAGREVFLDRYTGIPFNIQYDRVAALAKKYNNALTFPEANGTQDVHAEELERRGVRVQPCITNNTLKANWVDRLAGATERGTVTFQIDEAGILEMEAFESSRTPMGLVKFAAPEGMHDDIVMARLFAYSGIADSGPVLLWE